MISGPAGGTAVTSARFWRIESSSSAIEGNPCLRRPKDLRRNARPLPAARAFATKPISPLFRGDLRCRDELRHPLLSAFKVLAVHRLELGRQEGVRRWALEQCRAPSLEPRKRLDMAKLLHPVQQEVALQQCPAAALHHPLPAPLYSG